MKTTLKHHSPKENLLFYRFKLILKIKISFLILIYCCSFNAIAQAPLDAAVTFSGNEGTFKVVLPDTNDVSEIEMLVGSDDNESELFSLTCAYDPSSGLPTGVTYSRTGNEIKIGMGTVTLLSAYVAKVRLKIGSNSWSDWYEFIGN